MKLIETGTDQTTLPSTSTALKTTFTSHDLKLCRGIDMADRTTSQQAGNSISTALLQAILTQDPRSDSTSIAMVQKKVDPMCTNPHTGP